jgi:hypothetical protein
VSTNENKPLIGLKPGDSGRAPTISYNVPEPTSYNGRFFIELNLGISDEVIFNKHIRDEIKNRNHQQQGLQNNTVLDVETVKNAMKNGFSDQSIFPYIGQYAGMIRLQNNSNGEYEMKSNLPLSPELAKLSPEEVYSAVTGTTKKARKVDGQGRLIGIAVTVLL